jgi:hypothetical protein
MDALVSRMDRLYSLLVGCQYFERTITNVLFNRKNLTAQLSFQHAIRAALDHSRKGLFSYSVIANRRLYLRDLVPGRSSTSKAQSGGLIALCVRD